MKGDMKTVFENQKSHIESREKALRSELLKETPTPAAGGATDTMSLEKLQKMSVQERYDFSVKNPEEYKKLYGGNK